MRTLHFCIFSPNMGKGVAITEKPDYSQLGTFFEGSSLGSSSSDFK